ncbi:MAG: hypothetical protein A2091_06585 [Desulfuromonadales bacterium GWD2_61_12]|nr:MAG: hypothetical protein A2005_05045 [Desulfuromonadales bacterium GWC2_61_20]OGR32580.1 MAG: hypothetical protein A2091_06585 [Desulfuromonadales bacterium GWD2_61_12]
MIWRLVFAALVAAYCLLIVPFTVYLKDRPVVVKLGYSPHPQLLRAASGEHRPTVAALEVLRVLFYYGTTLQKAQEQVIVPPEYFNMYKALQGAVHLDPYNMDAYYFAQAAFTWELGRVAEVNHLLEIGMSKRTWDPSLPFYLGFNYAYFFKDYKKAACYMQRAAELSGNPLYAQLAARYFYESEQTVLGLAFLETMIQSSRDKAVRKAYEIRREALQAVQSLEAAVADYRLRFGTLPPTLAALVKAKILSKIPVDPYGGTFFLDAGGKVRTTSRFAVPVAEP